MVSDWQEESAPQLGTDLMPQQHSSSQQQQQGCTVLVRQLPLQWTSLDLSACFEQCGPVRHAFVVTHKKSRAPRYSAPVDADAATTAGDAAAATSTGPQSLAGQSRGMGFVTFAVASDAQHAIASMDNTTPQDAQRPIRVCEAVDKGAKKPMQQSATATTATGQRKTVEHSNTIATTATAMPLKVEIPDSKSQSATAPHTTDDDDASETDDEHTTTQSTKSERKSTPKASQQRSIVTPSSAVSASRVDTDTDVTPVNSESGASRILLLSNLHLTVRKLAKELQRALPALPQHCALLFPSPESTDKYKAARLEYATLAEAQQALTILAMNGGATVKGQQVRCVQLPVRSCRLIVRNLPFHTQEQHLRKLCSQALSTAAAASAAAAAASDAATAAAKPKPQASSDWTKDARIHDITVPRVTPNKAKGFAFVQCDSLQSAQTCIAQLNGSTFMGRTIALDFSLGKQDFDKRMELSLKLQTKLDAKLAKKATNESTGENATTDDVDQSKAAAIKNEQDDKSESDSDADNDELTIVKAVDSDNSDSDSDASMKDATAAKDEKVTVKQEVVSDAESNESDSDSDSDSASDDSSVSDSDASASDSDDDEKLNDATVQDDVEYDSQDEAEELKLDSASASQQQSKQQQQQKQSDTAEQRTLFIRNLAYTTTEEALLERFAAFGRVNYAKICMDAQLERSRGVGFVQYASVETAQQVLALVGSSDEEKQTQQKELTARRAKKDRFRAALQARSSAASIVGSHSSSQDGILLDGRLLSVTLAVDRQSASSMMQRNLKARSSGGVADKRNLYLAREGIILPDSEAASKLRKPELEQRLKAYRSKKAKLQNPNISVSATRLSVRNLPMHLTDAQLRRAMLQAASREDLAAGNADAGRPLVKQCKILRDSVRVDAQTGLQRSKRCGFVEFSTHTHALAALRALNNNNRAFVSVMQESVAKKNSQSTHDTTALDEDALTRPMIEFALEDSRKLLLRKQKQERAVQRAAQKKTLALAPAAAADKKKSAAAAAAAAAATKAADEAKTTTATKKGKQPKSTVSKRLDDAEFQALKATKAEARQSGACYKCGSSLHIAKKCRGPKTEQKQLRKQQAAVVAATQPTAGKKRKSDAAASSEQPAAAAAKRPRTAAPAAASAPQDAVKPAAKKRARSAADEPQTKRARAERASEARLDSLVNQHLKQHFETESQSLPTKTGKKWFD